MIAALTLQLLAQWVQLPFGRGRNLPMIRAYLRTHLAAPFRDLEGMRAEELKQVKARWKPLEKQHPSLA